MAKKLSIHKYRFAQLHQFKEFEKPVWYSPSGQKVKIIN